MQLVLRSAEIQTFGLVRGLYPYTLRQTIGSCSVALQLIFISPLVGISSVGNLATSQVSSFSCQFQLLKSYFFKEKSIYIELAPTVPTTPQTALLFFFLRTLQIFHVIVLLNSYNYSMLVIEYSKFIIYYVLGTVPGVLLTLIF